MLLLLHVKILQSICFLVLFITEFLMVKENINGSLIVTFRWNYKQHYAIAFRNKTLVIEVRTVFRFFHCDRNERTRKIINNLLSQLLCYRGAMIGTQYSSLKVIIFLGFKDFYHWIPIQKVYFPTSLSIDQKGA